MKKLLFLDTRRRCILHVGFIILLALLLLVSSAGAILVSQDFYVEIYSNDVSCQPCYDPVAAMAQNPYPSVGSKFNGSVTYDDTNIPTTGTYVIQTYPGSPPSPADEYQTWDLDWGGIYDWGGSIVPERLSFVDGKPSGIQSWFWVDADGGLEEEWFMAADYLSHGGFYYQALLPNGEFALFQDAWYTARGTLHFVPESSTMILLVSGLVGLGVVRKKYRK